MLQLFVSGYNSFSTNRLSLQKLKKFCCRYRTALFTILQLFFFLSLGHSTNTSEYTTMGYGHTNCTYK